MKQVFILLLLTSSSIYSIIPNEREDLRNKFARLPADNATERGYTFAEDELKLAVQLFFKPGAPVPPLAGILNHKNFDMFDNRHLIPLYNNVKYSFSEQELTIMGYPK
jgi:hypothetical protein